MNESLTTRFTGSPRWLAVLVLAGTVAAILCCLAVSLNPVPAVGIGNKKGRSDWEFYSDVTDRVRAGESYYIALPRLFEEYGHEPYSVFNFRTPIYAWLIAGLPSDEWAQALLAGLALLALGLAFGALRQESNPGVAMSGAFLLLGGLGWCFVRQSIYAQELWACTLITISICLYVLGRWPLAVLAGLAALFFRELTLPYCLLALGFAVWQRRPAEVVAWVGGLALYAAFMIWHLAQVAPLVHPSQTGGAWGWVVFGGVRFLLDTSRMNFFLIVLLPAWVTAFYLPIAVLGLAGWRGEMGTRIGLTVAAYLAAFSVVGQSFNLYWGLMDAPLLGLGLLWAPLAVRDLWWAARGAPALLAAHSGNHAAEERTDDTSSKQTGTEPH